MASTCWTYGSYRSGPIGPEAPAEVLVEMLWPAPKRSERVGLECTCQATVVWHVPFMFLYAIRIDQKGRDCMRATHVSFRPALTFLEAMTHFI
jgi:hypothetical protein